MSETGAENIRWDLTHLYADESDLRKDLNNLILQAQEFNRTWKGSVDSLDAGEFKEAIIRYD